MKKETLTRPAVVTLLACLCCLLWGSAVPFINLGYQLFAIPEGETASQILFAGCRFTLAGLLAVLIASVPRRRCMLPQPGNWGRVVRLSLVQTIAQYVFFYIGVAHTTSVKGAIIQGLNAFVTILIACYVFRSERMSARKWLGGLVGVAGIVLVNMDGMHIDPSVSLLGEGFLVISMVASAFSSGLIKRYSQHEEPVCLSGWQFVLGGLTMIAVGLLLGGRLHPQRMLALPVLLYLAMISAVAYSLWAVLLKHNPVSRVAVFTFLQPVFGVLLSLLLVDRGADVPLLRYGAALVLICVSIAVVNGAQQREARP